MYLISIKNTVSAVLLCCIMQIFYRSTAHGIIILHSITFPVHLKLYRSQKLREKQVYSTGTVRENRCKDCPLMDSKLLKKEKLGTYDYWSAKHLNTLVLNWNDNNIVCLVSNAFGVEPVHSVERFSRKEKSQVKIQQPNIVKHYNPTMGGVDLADENISCYRISIRGKKWYFPLVAHAFDLAVYNAWHLHRLDNGQLDHLAFKRRIALYLMESNRKESAGVSGRQQAYKEDLRYDRVDHLVIPQATQTSENHYSM